MDSNQLTVDGHERTGRDFLTPAEMASLIKGARKGRHGKRDAALISLMYYHGFRVSELCDARLTDLSLDTARIWVRRNKGSLSTEQPMPGPALRSLKAYLRTRSLSIPWLFVSERNGPLTRQAVNYLLRTAGQRAGLVLNVHPHMLRHSCGYYLANQGNDARIIQDYLGHRNPAHTARYTRTAASRFEGLWD